MTQVYGYVQINLVHCLNKGDYQLLTLQNERIKYYYNS